MKGTKLKVFENHDLQLTQIKASVGQLLFFSGMTGEENHHEVVGRDRHAFLGTQLKVYDLKSLSEIKNFKGMECYVLRDFSVSQDDSLVVTIESEESCYITFYDFATEREIYRLKLSKFATVVQLIDNKANMMIIYNDFTIEQLNLNFFYNNNVYLQGNFNFQSLYEWELRYYNPV